MVSEYDLPCTACGHTLSRSTVGVRDEGRVQVAVCPNCGSRHYPESSLEVFRTRGE